MTKFIFSNSIMKDKNDYIMRKKSVLCNWLYNSLYLYVMIVNKQVA